MNATVGFIVLAVFLFLGGLWIDSESCKAKAISFQAYTYGPIQGCMVKHKDRWLPLENIRGFD